MDYESIAILGTGTMGHGIVQFCAEKGLNVNMYGRSKESVNRGITNIEKNLKECKEYGKINNIQYEEILSKIKGVTDMGEATNGVNFVIECLAEEMEVKKSVFEKLDELCSEEIILATNTSALSPTEIGKVMKKPHRFVVTHFWNPPQLIPLVEIVPGEKTSNTTIEKTKKFIDFIGKKSVILNKECKGFIGNRLQLALLREALYIVEQGWAEPREVDKAMEYAHGRRLGITGPLTSADLGGLDIFYNIAKYLNEDLCNSKEPSKILEEKLKKSELGTKVGVGIYKWNESELKEIKHKRNKVLEYFLEIDDEKEK